MGNPYRSRGSLSKAVHARFRPPLARCPLTPSVLAWCAATGLLSGLCAYARPTAVRAAPLLSPFEHAERLHETLEEQPQQQRTRGDYERVLDAYRSIYHDNPASAKADASISAVAGLLAEEGRLFHSRKWLQDAIAQYEFLRREYPASRYRFSALLAEGEIYRVDLGDSDQAKATFQEFLKSYPRNPLAEEARSELREIRDEQSSERHNGRRQVQDAAFAGIPPATGSTGPFTGPSSGTSPALGAGRSAVAQAPAANGETNGEGSRKLQMERAAATPAQRSQASSAAQPGNDSEETSLPAPLPMSSGTDARLDSGSPSSIGNGNRRRRPRITAIRDWSTSEYTRIAIDLDAEVQYQEGRVAHPDRIYFDLRDVHLSPELAGKSITVTDGGFLKRIRAAQYSDDITRIVLDVNAGTDYSAFFLPNPWRLIVDIHGRKPGAPAAKEVASLDSTPFRTSAATAPVPVNPATAMPGQGAPLKVSRGIGRSSFVTPNARMANELDTLAAPVRARPVESVSVQPPNASGDDSVADSGVAASPKDLTANNGVDLHPGDELSANPGPAVAGARRSQPTGTGDRSLVRTLGLKIGRIVIDAGHGGHDSGTLGPGGLQEKDVTLDVSLRLGKLLKRRLGADVIYTRDDDTFVPLETRTAIANRSHADLFISVHANSSPDPTARGVESYYLNFTTSPEALEVAARENAVSDESIYQLSDLVKKITLRDKIEESREFAADVQESLYNGLEAGNPGLKDRGVKKAPFMVLIGANMPSILAEISFLTNPEDASELRQPAYRERIAEALYRGVARYINGLNGIRLAQNGVHPVN